MWDKVKKSQVEQELLLPIPFHPPSNGEFIPWDPTARERAAEKQYHCLVESKARKKGVSRRDFIHSACGMATGLLVLNQFMGCKSGSVYNIEEEATMDESLAKEVISSPHFIFDGHSHHNAFDSSSTSFQTYVDYMFKGSDTNVSCISIGGGLDKWAHERIASREILNKISEGQRILIQGKVFAERGKVASLEGMEEMATVHKISSWKLYPQEGGDWGFVDDAVGVHLIEKGRELGIKIFAAHKGLGPSSPEDMGPAAKAYPDCSFLCFHSGFEPGKVEGPYNPNSNFGIDRLIKTYLDNQIGLRAKNLYADLGATWNTLSSGNGGNMTQAAHVLGKLLKYMGEDQIIWGTDAVYLGSPDGQIAAFQNFQIPETMREQYGYPEITESIRAKIFGLNNARIYGIDPNATLKEVTEDKLSEMRRLVTRGHISRPIYAPLGPRTRREFFAMLKNGTLPG